MKKIPSNLGLECVVHVMETGDVLLTTKTHAPWTINLNNLIREEIRAALKAATWRTSSDGYETGD